MHLKETKYFIQLLQFQIQSDPLRGFWLVSFLSFIVAPFLTNDGVCLLFVEIILSAFQDSPEDSALSPTFAIESPSPSAEGPNAVVIGNETAAQNERGEENKPNSASRRLEKSDALYFLLALSCSSNIGSALTYTGNPQNMIVAQDALSVLSPMQFLAYMLLPTVLAWLMSK